MGKRKTHIAVVDVLNTLKGHHKEVITITDDPAEHARLSKTVTELIRDGYHVALDDGTKIAGYDAKTNEWLCATSSRKPHYFEEKTKRVSAEGKPATAVAPTAGG